MSHGKHHCIVVSLLLATFSCGTMADAPDTAKSGVYIPAIKPAIGSLEVARKNLAGLMSETSADVPGIKVPTMPNSCDAITQQVLRSLRAGSPGYVSVGCHDGEVMYAIVPALRAMTTAIHASNEISVNYSDLVGSDLSVGQIPMAQAQMHLIRVPTEIRNGPPADDRPYSTDVSQRPYRIILKNGASFHFKKQENAAAFADNLLFIQTAIKDAEGKRASAFEAKLASYRAGHKPAVTEEQRRLVVRANLLTQRKDFAQAFDMYLQAIDIDPVAYPDAYFNCALLAGEMERYPMAIDFMKKYLLLLPNSKEARQAQDKIYEWELLSERK